MATTVVAYELRQEMLCSIGRDLSALHSFTKRERSTSLKYLFVALLVAFAGVLAGGPALAGQSPEKITISARNFAFSPAVVTLKVGQPAELTFVGKEGIHGLTAPEIGLTQTVTITSKPTTVTVTPLKTGVFIEHCAIVCGAGHPKMHVTFRVVK